MNISVIIPVKNRAHLLPITLDNILGQTKKPYEIIVVDDGSTDAIDKLIERYNSKVIFTNNEGKGPGAARNTGLRLAKGNAIQFFDSDDLMTSNKLEVQDWLLEQHNADFVYGPNVKAVYKDRKWEQTDLIMQYYPITEGRLADRVLEQWCSITQSVLFNKSFIDKVGFWREDLMPHEDYEYWFRIGKAAKTFIHENESCVIYRQHMHQITDLQVNVESRWLDGLDAMQKINDAITYSPALKSLVLFKGRFAYLNQQYKQKFGKDSGFHCGSLSFFLIPYYKVMDKLQRMQTGNGWKKMHGVLSPGKNEFEKYISLL